MLLPVLLILAAPPPPPLPGDISAPLGHIGNVVDAPPKGGFLESDRVVLPKWEGCEQKGVYLMRFMGGTARVVEQLQQALDRGPGVEKKLFARKNVLTEVMRQLSTSKLEPKDGCKPVALGDGWRLELGAPPKKWCDAKADAQEGEFWFFSAGKPAGVISVQKGSPDACKPRLSTVLFDAKGVARVRVHADWGGGMSATLVGDKCQLIDFTLDGEKQAFVPTWKSCKR